MGELAARGGWKSLTRGGVWPWVDVFPSIFYWFSAFFYVILCVSIDKHVLCMSYASSMHVLCRHCELNPMSSLDATLGKPGPSRSFPFSLPRPSPCKAHERQVILLTFSVGARGKTVKHPRKDSLLSKSYHLACLYLHIGKDPRFNLSYPLCTGVPDAKLGSPFCI